MIDLSSIVVYLSFMLISVVVLTVAIRPLLNLTRYVFVYHSNESVLEKAFLFTGFVLGFVIISVAIVLIYTSIMSIFDASLTYTELVGIAFFFALITTFSRVSALGYRKSKDKPKREILTWKKRVIRSTYYSFLLSLLFLGLLGNAGAFVESDAKINIPLEASLDSGTFVLSAGLIIGVFLMALVGEAALGDDRSPLYVPEELRD